METMLRKYFIDNTQWMANGIAYYRKGNLTPF